MSDRKIKRILFISAMIISAVVLVLDIFVLGDYVPKVKSAQTQNSKMQIFDSRKLSKYNGTDSSLPIYIAMDGLVYDVTAGRQYYQTGGPYHYLAGRDSSTELHLAGGNIIKSKYPVIGIYKDQ